MVFEDNMQPTLGDQDYDSDVMHSSADFNATTIV